MEKSEVLWLILVSLIIYISNWPKGLHPEIEAIFTHCPSPPVA
jgi:hypothetical protein